MYYSLFNDESVETPHGLFDIYRSKYIQTFLFAIVWHDFVKLEEILKGNLKEISIFLKEILVQIRKK
jgi:hypothetical protein